MLFCYDFRLTILSKHTKQAKVVNRSLIEIYSYNLILIKLNYLLCEKLYYLS